MQKSATLRLGVTVLSPPSHSAFSNAEELLNFVKQLSELSAGKPIGFKLCIGDTNEFEEICIQMNALKIYPDFITIDGTEGGTGAAPPEFSDGVGMPLEPALIFVNKTLKDYTNASFKYYKYLHAQILKL